MDEYKLDLCFIKGVGKELFYLRNSSAKLGREGRISCFGQSVNKICKSVMFTVDHCNCKCGVQ